MIKVTGLPFKELKQFSKFCSQFRLNFPASDWDDIEKFEQSKYVEMKPSDPVDIYITGDHITWYPTFINIPDDSIDKTIDYRAFMYNLKNDYLNTISNGKADKGND